MEHARANRRLQVPLTAYSRFLLHALDEQQEEIFITALDRHLESGDRVYMEYRCSKDADTPKVFGQHYRRFVDSDKLLSKLSDELSFTIDYSITGQGMARYKNEDPFVTRIIATKI